MKIIQKIILVLLFVLVFCISFTSSNDFSQDLGRHLKLGDIILQTRQIPKNNLFSYTNPSFPFINHHWGAEVIFYLLAKYTGLNSLIVLKTILTVSTFVFLIKAGFKKGNVIAFVFTSILFLPLLLDRLDIRPELFGYVFFSLFLYILFFQDNNKLFFTIPFIMFFWVNTHITFIFGSLLICIYFLFHIKQSFKSTSLPLVLSIPVLLFNPNGLQAVLYPLNIFKNYGYTIVENQNIFFLNSVTVNPIIKYFFMIIPFVLISLFILLTKRKFSYLLLLLIFFLLPFWQIRHMPFFVFIAIPIVGYVLTVGAMVFKNIQKGKLIKKVCFITLFTIIVGFILLFISNTYYRIFDKDKFFGMGFDESQKQATDFVVKEHLSENIFNNFDIGGYVIYRLYPQYKVFVDNRPESYPSSFFTQTYIPLQENASLRRKIFNQYGIHTVLFSHTDMTPWGRRFLADILHDKNWKLVFMNKSTVVLTDKGNLSDIRSSEVAMTLIDQEGNYISLLQLASVFSLMNKNEESIRAFKKAQAINPDSCTIKRVLYAQTQETSRYFLQDSIKKPPKWCF